MIEPLLWLVLFLILIIIEAVTLGLTTIWMAGGALVAAIVSAVGGPMWLQFLLFVVVSVVLFVCTRPIALNYFNKDRVKTNVDEMIGKHAVVTEEIDNLRGSGRVEVAGMQWTARAQRQEIKIPKGTEVVIESISGVKAICRPVDESRQLVR